VEGGRPDRPLLPPRSADRDALRDAAQRVRAAKSALRDAQEDLAIAEADFAQKHYILVYDEAQWAEHVAGAYAEMDLPEERVS
jgi:hypothetical protein